MLRVSSSLQHLSLQYYFVELLRADNNRSRLKGPLTWRSLPTWTFANMALSSCWRPTRSLPSNGPLSLGADKVRSGRHCQVRILRSGFRHCSQSTFQLPRPAFCTSKTPRKTTNRCSSTTNRAIWSYEPLADVLCRLAPFQWHFIWLVVVNLIVELVVDFCGRVRGLPINAATIQS